MASFTASFAFEAESLDAAETELATWQVSPGAALQSLTGMVASPLAGVVPDSGSVADLEPFPPAPEPEAS
jgi:hypothetical protein